MYRQVGLIVLLAFVLTLTLAISPANASGASCVSDPTSGPPGTAFTIVCSGFSGGIIANTYVVEPDGRALSGLQINGFRSNLGNGSVLTDMEGQATFTWQSAGGGAVGFADQLGGWTWVVHQLAPGGNIFAKAQVTVNITSKPEVHSGATLNVTPSAGTTFNFTGAGFVPNEIAHLWVTLPANCSGRFDTEGASAIDPLSQGSYDGVSGPNSAKADQDGNIAFSLVFAPEACRGQYTVTARALSSGIGGEVDFEVTGDAIVSNALLAATPDSVTVIAPFLNLLGSGFTPGSHVNCWTTRPDGRAFSVGTVVVNSSGNFVFNIHVSDFDSIMPYASEEPGVWYATCRTPNGDMAATTSFLVTSLTSDP